MNGLCLAMWSGPRNISTAMMRAWENRADTVVVDEPFYAHFLDHTGIDHPMREQIIAAGETDWRKIVDSLVMKPATGVYYQKHITTHWMEHFSVDWLEPLEHVFLIREPAPVVASYAIKRMALTATDLGYVQQAALFDQVTSIKGTAPLVIDSQRFLQDPAAHLQTVCDALAINFDPAMLSWPAGLRDSDGIWSEHWYDAVRQSTGFAPYQPKTVVLDTHQQRIADCCQPYYDAMKAFAI